MGGRRGEFGAGGDPGNVDLERLRENVLDHPDESVAGNESYSTANGNQLHFHGLSTTQGLVILGIAILSLAYSITQGLIQNGRQEVQNGKHATLLERVQACEKKAEIATLRTEGFTRALIAKEIDPYPHLTGEPP